MILNKKRVPKNIQLGKSVKSVAVSLIDTIEETTGTLTDVAITTRSVVELVHGALQEPIAEQRIDLALTIQSGLTQLEAAGMGEEEARRYLQCEEITVSTAKETNPFKDD